MKIYNKTKKQIIAEKAKITKNVFQRIIGLLFKKQFDQIDALIIHPCNGVHSVGMRFYFDALYLQKDLVILKMFENVKPNQFLPISFKTGYVVELPKNTIKEKNIEQGDILELID